MTYNSWIMSSCVALAEDTVKYIGQNGDADQCECCARSLALLVLVKDSYVEESVMPRLIVEIDRNYEQRTVELRLYKYRRSANPEHLSDKPEYLALVEHQHPPGRFHVQFLIDRDDDRVVVVPSSEEFLAPWEKPDAKQ